MRVLIVIFILLYLGCKYPHRNKDIVLGNWQYVALRDSTQTLDLTLDSLTISFGLDGKFELHYKVDTMLGFYKTKRVNKFDYIYVPLVRKLDYLYATYPNKIVNLGKKMGKKNDDIYRKYIEEKNRGINIVSLRKVKFNIVGDSLVITDSWYHQRTNVFKRIP
jgi:hypothetical protein